MHRTASTINEQWSERHLLSQNPVDQGQSEAEYVRPKASDDGQMPRRRAPLIRDTLARTVTGPQKQQLARMKCISVVESEVVEMPLGRYIPVSVKDLNTAMQRHLNPDDRLAWEAFAENMRLVVSTFYDGLVGFTLDSYDALHHSGSWEHSNEKRFYKGVTEVLRQGSYRPLPQFWWDNANGYKFNFTLDVIPDWDSMGSDELSAFIQRGTVYSLDQVPLFANNVLIYTRGMDVKEKTEYYLWAKIDYLVDKLMYGGWHVLKKILADDTEPAFARPSTKHTAVIRRHTLESRIKEMGLMTWLFSKVTLVEPSFESVVIIYPYSEVIGGKVGKDMKMEIYNSVPMADLEGLLPFKQIHLRPFDTFYFLIQLVLIALFLTGIVQTFLHGEVSTGLAFFLMTIALDLSRRFYNILYAYMMVLILYQSERLTWQASKLCGDGRSVLSLLRDQVVSEELKQLLLTYFSLWQGGPQSIQRLDSAADLFLKDEFCVEANMDIDDAAAKLVRLGLADLTTVSGGADELWPSGSPQQILPQFEGLRVLHEIRLL
jgi:hypothetical protein